MGVSHEPEQQIGQVTHWFGHNMAAAVSLSAPLSVGDRIHIVGHVTDVEETVHSMQIDHRAVETAGPGDDVAIDVSEHVREHDRILLVK